MELVIMAAGLGSRFGGLKQLEPIDQNGNFIIDYSIFDAKRCGFNKVIFIIKEENYELFRNSIGKRIENIIDTKYVFQNTDNIPDNITIPQSRVKPFGTGHAILCAKNEIKDSFAVINADDYYGYDAFKQIASFIKSNNSTNEYAIVSYSAINTISDSGSVKRGICKCENEYLKDITESSIDKNSSGTLVAQSVDTLQEKYEISDDTPVSMNLFGFTTKFLDYLDSYFVEFLNKNKDNLETCEFFLPTVVANLIKADKAKVKVLKTSSKWQGITYKQDKPAVEKYINELINKNVYPKSLWEN